MTTFFDTAMAKVDADRAQPKPRWRHLLDERVALNRLVGAQVGRHRAGAR